MILGIIKNILVFISLFYLTFYIPFVLTAYNPYWMKYNCNLHKRCDLIGIEKADRAISNLTSFLMHREELGKEWKRNERIHLSEVRDIFDTMFFAAVISAVVLAAFRNKRPKLYKFAAVNIIVALCLLIVLPNFKTFWRDIFHPLLFDNDLWKVTRSDLLFYVTPRSFFKITTAVILASWVVLNILTIVFSVFNKGRSKKPTG